MSFLAAATIPSPAAPHRKASGFLKLALAYAVVYVALNVLVAHRALQGSAITLWSPDNALSLMLIMESAAFAPVVWIAQIVTDLTVYGVNQPRSVIIAADTTLALGYMVMAISLKHGFGLNLRAMSSRDLIAIMAVTPLGAALTGAAYCGALWLVGALPAREFARTYADFWIGDAAAMGVIIPAVGASFKVWRAAPWRQFSLYTALMLAVTLGFLMVIIAVSVSEIDRRYLFNLLYLPIMLIGLKHGYEVGAIALLFVQTFLLFALDYYHVPIRLFGGYQVMMFVLAVSGQAIGAAVTEWEAAMSRLRAQQQELGRLSERAANGVLAAAIAHEISQPLAAIATFVHGARRLVAYDAQRAESALGKAEDEAARARAIVERLRDLVATGAVVKTRVDLDALVDRIFRVQEDFARERGVALRRRGGGALAIEADGIGVEQAFNNLVVNAIEAAGRAGVCVTLSAERRGDRAVLSVEDDGPGVRDDIADRLFEPFETSKARGMGLGLALAREIAKRHGGALRHAPVVPHGARFELELPLA